MKFWPFFAAATALVCWVAFAAQVTAPFSVTVVSNSVAPAPAAAAGFTTLAFQSDFTQPSYASTATWLDCAGAPSPKWFLAWSGFTITAPCSSISQQTDPLTSQPVLQLHWQDSYNTAGGPNSINMQTGKADIGGGNLHGIVFPFSYMEVTGRSDTVDAIHFGDFWSYSSDGQSVEWDGIEWISNSSSGSDSCYHNNNQGVVNCLWFNTFPPNGAIDFTQYHKFAWRVTSDGVTGAFWCAYIDDVLEACQSWTSSAQQIQGNFSVPQFVQFFWGVNGTRNGNNNANLYVKSVRVFSCPQWNAGSKCFSSSPNP